MRIYGDLAEWFHLLTHPDDYAEEAAFYQAVIEEALPEAQTLLELGSGGGNNASYLKQRFDCTLTDLSPPMLELSRSINPELEHIEGDMRTLRLGRTFDVVFLHDAVDYMLTENDLRAAIVTAFEHTRPGGVALFVPDGVTESFSVGTDTGGHDGPDGRALRYLEWIGDLHEDGIRYDLDFAVLLKEPGKPTRMEHDHQEAAVYPRATWKRLLAEAGFQLLATEIPDPYESDHEVFVVRRPA